MVRGMDVANFVVACCSLLVGLVIGMLAYRLQRASRRREQRDDRRAFAMLVDEWARAGETELLGEKPPVGATYLREALKSDRKTVEKMRPEFLIEHVERALERIGTIPTSSRAAFVESVRVMRLWNVRRWIVDPTTTAENQAYWATAAASASVSVAAEGRVETSPGLHGEGTLGLLGQ